MKKCTGFLLAAMLLCGCILGSIGIAPREVRAEGTAYVAKDAPASVNDGYTPTQLINGSFEDYPANKFFPLSGTGIYGVGLSRADGAPWNTSDTSFDFFVKNDTAEWYAGVGVEYTPFGNYCVELNANTNGVLYQDLPTNSRDIIYWSLYHAPRAGGPAIQSMNVHIGAPAGAPSGVNPNISGGAEWTTAALSGTGGYDIAGGRAALAVTIPDGGINASTRGTWKQAYGVYIVPAGQSTTRFAFTAEQGGQFGNVLDNIHFDTLLGNLKVSNAGEYLHVTGHWGKCDQNDGQTLDYLFKNKDGATVASGSIDMSALTGDDFQADIDISKLPLDENSMAEFWHSAYPDAKTPVDLSMLFFRDDPKYDIPKVDVGKPIAPIDVTDGVSGGKPGYTFSAEGLPDGFSISADGVITGSYPHPTKPGTATIKVTDSEGAWRSIEIAYGGTAPIAIDAPADPANPGEAKSFAIDPIPPQEFTGGEITPEIVVRDPDGNPLTKDVDYTVEYQNNVEPGEAIAVIKGIGDYAGTLEGAFSIKAPPGTDEKAPPKADTPSKDGDGDSSMPKLGDRTSQQFWFAMMMLFLCTGAVLELFKLSRYTCKH